MLTCQACGFLNAEGMRFCGGCGERLSTSPTAIVRERKTVSVLFCDLVGFTTASDGADPEDVQAALSPYHVRMRSEIEAFGGTVEKFIGDAVMAVFGAPVTHEDDAERAVRAGLRLLEAVDDLNDTLRLGLAVRIGIATGTAVVTTTARPEVGEGMVAGDVVNTAARLQTAAAPETVVVGEATWRATRTLIDYKELPPAAVKGKAQPVPVWQALGARSRVGEAVADTQTSFVGRDDELEILQRTFGRCQRERSVQLVTIVGEPGIGKSRLVQEFFEWIDSREELITWRQGRCLPYGAGTPMWALGQMIKAHAGILDTDDQPTAAQRLQESIRVVLERSEGDPDERAEWMALRLRPIVGLEGPDAAREELFAAAQVYLEGIAATGPAVLIFEDLHWAERPLLDFVEHLLEWVADVPVLLLATARPELYDVVPTWGGGKRNASTISLSPLTEQQTTELVGSLMGNSAIAVPVHEELLRRAAGNPLYAREFVAMVMEQQHGDGGDVSTPEATITFPDSVQAVIAARLDTLPAPAKTVLQGAAVVGHAFWSGAVSALTEDGEEAVLQMLHELRGRDYLRRSRTSTFVGQVEYTFAHALIRDVAYDQIPRSEKAERHEKTASWLSAMVADNPGEYAAIIADHYDRARSNVREDAGQDDGHATTLTVESRRWHQFAAELVLPVDPGAAVSHYRAALATYPVGTQPPPQLMAAFADALSADGQWGEAVDAFEAAERRYSALDEPEQAAALATQRAHCLHSMGKGAQALELLDESCARLEAVGRSLYMAEAYSRRALVAVEIGRFKEGTDWATRALDTIADLPRSEESSRDRDEIIVRALSARGVAEATNNPRRAHDDFDQALALSLKNSLIDGALRVYNGLAVAQTMDSAESAVPIWDDAIDLALERGRRTTALGLLTHNKVMMLRVLGRLSEALELGRSSIAQLESMGRSRDLVFARIGLAGILVDKGDWAEAKSLMDRLESDIQESGDPIDELGRLTVLYQCARMDSDIRAARWAAEQLAKTMDAELERYLLEDEDCAVHGEMFVAAERPDIITRILGSPRARACPKNNALQLEALLREADEEPLNARHLYREAASGWRSYGYPAGVIRALLGAARCTLALGEPAEPLIHEAGAIAARIGHVPLQVEVNRLSQPSSPS